ncbi:MAG: 4-hydroxy-tetrahydrodipicolinate synthase [Miltoncostaeaceae bacterium]
MQGGILTAMVTPFHSDGSIDLPSFERLAAHLLDNGSDGLVVAGTTGEASTLDDREKLDLFAAAVRVADGQAPVMAGTGSNDTAHSVELTARAAEVGVDSALVVTPYYNRPNREGIVGHVGAVAEVGLPLVLYNIPSRTTVNMEPDLLDELAGLEAVVGVKQANPDLDECRATVEAGRLTVWAGNDDMLLPVLEMGGEGVISVTSHLAGERMQSMVRAARAGNLDEARAIDSSLEDLYAGLFITTNPIPVKAACVMLGLIPEDHMRLPMVPATPVQREIVRTTLDAQNLLATA